MQNNSLTNGCSPCVGGWVCGVAPCHMHPPPAYSCHLWSRSFFGCQEGHSCAPLFSLGAFPAQLRGRSKLHRLPFSFYLSALYFMASQNDSHTLNHANFRQVLIMLKRLIELFFYCNFIIRTTWKPECRPDVGMDNIPISLPCSIADVV